jgi:hypothetical protein
MVMYALRKGIRCNSIIAPWLAHQVAHLSGKRKVRLVEGLCHFISGGELELQRIWDLEQLNHRFSLHPQNQVLLNSAALRSILEWSYICSTRDVYC